MQQEDYYPFMTDEISKFLSHSSHPLKNPKDLDSLMDFIGDAKYVLLGEASHGTHEYYTWRIKITQRLIEEKGFSFVAAEGDWPDCYKINRYVKSYPYSGKNAVNILKSFCLWPNWLLANWEMVAFIDWLKTYNKKMLRDNRIGFYGLDIYSSWEAIQVILKYLKNNNIEAFKKAKSILKSFGPLKESTDKTYTTSSSIVPELCEKEILNLLKDIRSKVTHYNSDVENIFNKSQNVIVSGTAEKFYRTLISGGAKLWNTRDKYMESTLSRLMDFHGKKSKVIIWEHNNYIGDAGATPTMSESIVNLGQIITEKYAADGVVAVGFGSYNGNVVASREWGDKMQKIDIPDAEEGSWEHAFHIACKGADKLLLLNKVKKEECISSHISHRTIGLVYNPEKENVANYIPTIMPMRYDAFIFLDKTKALHPLHFSPNGDIAPDSYPFGV